MTDLVRSSAAQPDQHRAIVTIVHRRGRRIRSIATTDRRPLAAAGVSLLERRIVRTRSGEATSREDGILCFRVLPGVEQNEKNALENLEACLQIAGGSVVPLLVDLRETGPVTREARYHYAHQTDFAPLAMLVGSPFTRIVASLFLHVGRPDQPTKLFTSEAEAIRWLEGFLR